MFTPIPLVTNLIQGWGGHVHGELGADDEHVALDIGAGHLDARERCEQDLFMRGGVRSKAGEGHLPKQFLCWQAQSELGVRSMAGEGHLLLVWELRGETDVRPAVDHCQIELGTLHRLRLCADAKA